MLEFKVPIRARYRDTDQMGIIHHSNYVAYFEEARGEAIRQLGFTYKEMEDQGVMMPVVDVQLHYYAPAYYDDLLTFVVRIEKMPMARIEFFYDVYNQREELINKGKVVLGFMHSSTRRPCRAPEWFLDVLRKAGMED